MPKFSANISYFFTNKPFLERYRLARDAGFKAVEGFIPPEIAKEDVSKAAKEAGVRQFHMDAFRGNLEKDEFGFAALPGKEKEYWESLTRSLEYAKELNTKILHIAAGYIKEPIKTIHHDTYIKNLRESVPLLEESGIVGVIEPITVHTRPLYYLNSIKRALHVVRTINSPFLKLELDIFHAQQIQGDLTFLIKDAINDIAHVQIAQVPNRNEPDTEGEINYKYLIDLLDREGYRGYIGLEYNPKYDTLEGLKWIRNFGYSIDNFSIGPPLNPPLAII